MICGCLFPYFATLKVYHWFLLHDNLLRHYTPQHIISYFLSLMAHTSKLPSLCYSLLEGDQNDMTWVLGLYRFVREEFDAKPKPIFCNVHHAPQLVVERSIPVPPLARRAIYWRERWDGITVYVLNVTILVLRYRTSLQVHGKNFWNWKIEKII